MIIFFGWWTRELVAVIIGGVFGAFLEVDDGRCWCYDLVSYEGAGAWHSSHDLQWYFWGIYGW